MANKIYNYDTPSEFLYDSAKVDVSGGIASLKLTTDFDGLVGYWKFEDNALDSSGQGNDGTVYGATYVDGKVGRCLSFDGTGDYVDCGTSSSLEISGDMTISLWFNATAFEGGGALDSLVTKRDSGGTQFQWGIVDDGIPVMTFFDGTTTRISTTTLSTGTWYHAAVIVSSGTVTFYLNGVSDGSGTVTITSDDAPLYIAELAVVSRPFNGLIDEVAIYNRALSLSEIQDHYNVGAGRYLIKYPQDKPTIEPTDLFDPVLISSWDSFLEILGGGNQGNIGYNLYKVDKANKYYWNGSAWVTGGSASNYNSQATINTNIGSFDASPDKIGFIAYLISDGEQQVELDENQITYTINQAPLINAGSNKTCQDNETISPFSDCSFSDPDGTIDHVYYKVDGEVDTWSEIPQGGYGTLLEAVQAWTYQFANLGIKTVRLQVKDNNDETAEDSLTVTVSQYTVTFNVKDSLGNHVNDFYFLDGINSTPQLKSSPFSYEYEYKATPYATTFYKDGYIAISANVNSTDHTENITLAQQSYIETSRIYHPIRIDIQNQESVIKTLIKGDTILFEVKVEADITDWKIRAELWDSGSIDIKKTTSNSGGSDFEIEITNATEGIFIIKIDKGETTNILDQATLEIELETNESKIYTVYQSILNFVTEKITWDTP